MRRARTVTAELTKRANTKALQAAESAGAEAVWGARWIRTGDVVVPGPEVDVDGVQDGEEGEAPGDAVDDDLLSAIEELVDDGSEEEEVNKRPRSG